MYFKYIDAFYFAVGYFIVKFKMKNLQSVSPSGSVSMTGSFKVIVGLPSIGECCDCHHHNTKSYFVLSHICATFPRTNLIAENQLQTQYKEYFVKQSIKCHC